MFNYTKLLPNLHIIINSAERFRTEFNITFSSAGGYFEEEGQKGVTHLLEHCMVKRTKDLDHKGLRKNNFKKDIYLNASTGITTLNIVTSGHKTHKEEMLKMALEMSFTPTISEEILVQERQIVLREINERRGAPNYRLGRMVYEEVYEQGSRNLIEVLGKSEDVAAASLETLKTIHRRMLEKSHIVITVSGGQTTIDEVLDIVRPYCDYLTSDKALAVDFDIKNKYKNFTFKPIVSELAHEQVDLELVIPCDVTLQNSPLRVFLYRLLLNPPHGVLYNKLRNELGHVYHIDGGFYSASDTFNIYATSEIGRAKEVIDEIKKVFESYEEIITKENVETIKNLLVQNQELLQDNPQESVNFTENRLFDYGTVETVEEFIDSLQTTKIEDIQAMFEQLKNNIEKMQIIAVSNNEEIKEII